MFSHSVIGMVKPSRGFVMPGKHSYRVMQLRQVHTVGTPLTVGQVLCLNDLRVLSFTTTL